MQTVDLLLVSMLVFLRVWAYPAYRLGIFPHQVFQPNMTF